MSSYAVLPCTALESPPISATSNVAGGRRVATFLKCTCHQVGRQVLNMLLS